MSDQTAEIAAEERRRARRQRVLKGAVVVFGRFGLVFDCQIRNLTDLGAKLMLASTVGVPNEFELLVSADRRIAPVKVVWRNDRELGVEFTGSWRDHFGKTG